MAQLEVLSAERRRRWSRSEKERLVAASFEAGVSASAVARSAGIHVSQLFRWRKQLCERVVAAASMTMVPVVIAEPSGPAAAAPTKPRRTRGPAKGRGLIEIDLGGGRRLRVDAGVDAKALARVLDVLSSR
jgi:transposase